MSRRAAARTVVLDTARPKEVTVKRLFLALMLTRLLAARPNPGSTAPPPVVLPDASRSRAYPRRRRRRYPDRCRSPAGVHCPAPARLCIGREHRYPGGVRGTVDAPTETARR